MRMNKYLASTLIAGLFVTATVFSPAMGQEQTLQPEGAWSVTKIDRSTQGGNSYCTLSRKYSNGAVLSLGRNQTEEYSLALDFQKPVFEKDKALKINLQPGPGQIRAYDMMPTSEKAVVIRLGWDTGFFDALNQSQQMKVKIADQNYAFATPEIAKGQANLQDCMEELQSAAKEGKGEDKVAQNTKDVLNAEPVNSSKDFSAGRMDEAKIQVAAQEKKIVQNFAQSMEDQEAKSKGEKPQNLAAKSAPDEGVKMAAVEPAAGPKDEPEMVKRPFATNASVESNKKEMEALRARLDKMAQENKALKENSGKLPPEAQKQMASLSTEKQSLQAKIDQLQKEKEAMPAPQELAAIQTKAKALETEKAALEANLRDIQEKSKQASVQSQQATTSKMSDLERKISSIQKINTELSHQLETAQAEKLAMIEPAAQAEESQAQVETLQQKLNAVANENETLKQKAATAADAQKQVTAAQAEKKALQDRLAQMQQETSQKVAPQDYAAAQARAKELETKSAQLEENLRQAQLQASQAAQAVKTSTEAAQKTTSMEAELAAARKNNADLKQQLDGLKEGTKMAMAQPLPEPIISTDEYNKLQKQLSDLTSENAILKEKAAATPPVPDAQKLAADFDAEKKALQDKITILQKDGPSSEPSPDKAELMDQLKELQIKNAQLEDTLRQSQVRIGETAINIESKSLRTIADLESKLAAARADNTTLAQKIEDFNTQEKNGRMDLVAGNWDLEKATQRFNESERENRRLSLQAEQQKTVCSREKAEIEQMLFDPAVTDQKQLEHLHDLEAQLEDAKGQLAGRPPMMSASAAAPERNTGLSKVDQEMEDLRQAMAEKNAAAARNNMQAAQAPYAAPKVEKVSLDDREGLNRPNRVSMATPPSKPQVPATPAQKLASMDPDSPANIEPASGVMTPLPPVPKDKPSGYSKNNLQTLLQSAGLSGGLQPSGAGWKGADNYAWNDGNVKGLASVKKMSGNFDGMVNQYIAYQKSQCGGGDFASMPSPASGNAAQKMALYEVACVGASQSTSSSMVFFEQDGRFVAISNQIGAADMDVAMDSRDKIADAARKL